MLSLQLTPAISEKGKTAPIDLPALCALYESWASGPTAQAAETADDPHDNPPAMETFQSVRARTTSV